MDNPVIKLQPLSSHFQSALAKKHAYRFNPHTLSYERVVVTVRERMKKISYTVAFGLVLGFVFTFLAFHFLDSPKERLMKRELANYRRELNHMNSKLNRAELVLKDLEKRDDNIYRTIFEVNPIHTGSQQTEGSAWDSIRRTSSREQLDYTNSRIASLESRLYEQSLSYDKVYQMARSQKERLLAMPAIMPIAKGQCQLVSGFGTRYHPVLRYSRPHTGVDLAAKTGTPIYATADGTVTEAGRNVQNRGGYGVICVINHGFGYQTLYAHLIEVKARVGQKVKRGELIGWVGSTGLSSGPHLHYEVILNGRHVNPVYYFFNDLTPAEFEEILEAANEENQCLS